MKLTKGKISKLYNKKRQSLKKHKRLKSSYKKRTFRNKRKVNLARKSLKRFNYKKYKGGEGDDDNKVVDTPKDVQGELINQPIIEANTDTTGIEKTDEPVTETTNKPLIETTNEPVIEKTEQPVPEKTEGIEEIPIQPTEELSPEDVEKTEQPVTETTDEPVTETMDEGPVTETSKNTELVNSLTNIADYIADIVAEKVSSNQIGDKIQNGFDSVNKASETIANSGGSKFKKTRRFRLTNKNKTRHK